MQAFDRERRVNLKAAVSPDDVARACADAMWAEDDASKGLGMEIVEIGPGFATLAMNVRPDICLLYTSPSPRDGLLSRMPSSA